MPLKHTWWSREDIDRIMHLRDIDKLGWPQIAKEFRGRTVIQVRARYHGELARRKAAADPIVPRAKLYKGTNAVADRNRQPPVNLPDHATLTAELLGDPRPGRSALDKRRAGIVDQASNHRSFNLYSPLVVLPAPGRPGTTDSGTSALSIRAPAPNKCQRTEDQRPR